jgi:hypothetical protein
MIYLQGNMVLNGMVGDKRHIIGYHENCQIIGYYWLKG